MAKKPLELQSLKWPFVGLSVLLALCAAWSVYDEVFARRPWKNFQRDFFALETKHLKEDQARYEKHLNDPAVKAEREKALAELKAANEAISGNAEQRRAYDEAVAAETKAKIAMDEAKLNRGFAASEADAVYYKLREARHEADKHDEESLQKEFDRWNATIKERDGVYQANIAKYEAAQKKRLAFQQRREAAQAKVDQFDKPVAEYKEKIEALAGKWPQMEQYWITGLKNSWGSPTVDRCQNCHAGIDKGGFSAPWEVLEAKRNKMPKAEFEGQFAIDDEVVDAYQAAFDKICEKLPEEPLATPVGGYSPPKEPEPVTARLTAGEVCKDHKSYDNWLELSAAFCGKKNRALAKSKVYFLDAAGKIVAREARDEHGHPTWSWACTDKTTADALDGVAKNSPFDVKPEFRTHPYRFDLIVKNHPAEQFGCTTCHGGEGAKTKGVMHHKFEHGRDDHDWNDPLTDTITVMGRRFEGAFMQSKCDKCHAQDYNLEHAPLLSKGKKLFTDVGCWGCHPIEGYADLPKRGPTLTTIAAKTTAGWLKTWIEYPRGWRPGTRMPNFWPGAVDAKAVPHSIDAKYVAKPDGMSDDEVLASHRALRDEEVTAIIAYLFQNQEPSKLLEVPAGGDARRGKDLFDNVGCRACHVAEKGSTARRSEGSKDRDYAPNLWNVGDKTSPQWIYSWVKNPKAMWPETKMPDLRLTDAEAADVAAYLSSLKSELKYPTPAELEKGKDLTALAAKGKDAIAKYGCFGCHNIKGFENAQKIGTELTEHGRKDPNLLDFGDVHFFTEDPKHRETYANWVWMKLATPRIYAYERVETKMPQFDFSEDERLAILTFLKGQTGERPDKVYLAGQDPQKASVLAGERMVFWNGCRNCHIVEKRGGAIRDLFNEDNQSYAPPIITGEGWKTQPQWLFAFLKNPVGPASEYKNLRPWVKVRMPTFHFTDADATALVQYFDSASNKPFPYLTTTEGPQPSAERLKDANALFTELKCLSCHVVGELRPGQDPGSAAPNLLLAKHRLRPDWIPAWLTNPQALMDGTRMPSFWDFSDPKKPSAPSQAFHGVAQDQIDALRDLLMHLDEEPAASPKQASGSGTRHNRGG